LSQNWLPQTMTKAVTAIEKGMGGMACRLMQQAHSLFCHEQQQGCRLAI